MVPIEDKKKQLLQAAHHVFSQKGYKGANIAAIAKEAKIAVGSFYKYFDSKEEIFIEIYVTQNDLVRNKIIQAINCEGVPAEVIDELFTYSIKYTSNNRILGEWSNPTISETLHSYYLTKKIEIIMPFINFWQKFSVKDFKKRILTML